MHDIEPFYDWQYLYNSEDDELSPFYGTEHSEFSFKDKVYNYFIHPQWDNFGSETLYIKILFVDYDDGYCILECIGEWNDAVADDVQTLKRNIIDTLIALKIYKYILITENVLNYHSGDADYYQEWQEDIEDANGYIVWLNLPKQSEHDFNRSHIKDYVLLLSIVDWRTGRPSLLFEKVEAAMRKFLN
jgi:hypothetical protein